MSTLIAITYADEQTGRAAFAELGNLQKMQVLKLEDAAIATKNAKGKVKVKQTLEKQYLGTVTTWGFFWGLFTALLSRIFGKSTDLGIDNKFIKEVGDSLEIGGAAIFMLVIEATQDKVLPEMAKFGGKVYQTSLSNEDEEKLRKALEHDEVKTASEQTLDLEETVSDEPVASDSE